MCRRRPRAFTPPQEHPLANDHKDYSGTPLPKKLGIRDGSRVFLVNAPDGFDRLLTPMPDGLEDA